MIRLCPHRLTVWAPAEEKWLDFVQDIKHPSNDYRGFEAFQLPCMERTKHKVHRTLDGRTW